MEMLILDLESSWRTQVSECCGGVGGEDASDIFCHQQERVAASAVLAWTSTNLHLNQSGERGI